MTENFILRAKIVHGDTYDYSLTEYVNAKTKVTIVCKIHGPFEQEANGHLKGYICKKCSNDAKRKTTPKFIEEAIKIHRDTYDYSLVDYKQSFIKIKIICKIHGLFEQTPQHYLEGTGCSKCKKRTTKEFIEDAKKKHGDKYDYKLTVYEDCDSKVKIICKIHGPFEQTPVEHIRGSGCPHCVNKTEGIIKEILILNGIPFETQCNVDGKKIDFLVNSDYILEIDGTQHFPHLRAHQKIPKEKLDRAIFDDISKMESLIDYYPIVRLFQENIWNNRYDWKTFILGLKNLEVGTLYIRSNEKDIYGCHTSNFNTEYI